jgi:hypothetical protein
MQKSMYKMLCTELAVRDSVPNVEFDIKWYDFGVDDASPNNVNVQVAIEWHPYAVRSTRGIIQDFCPWTAYQNESPSSMRSEYGV